MRGFGNFASAARFCRAFDELRTYFRSRHPMGETLSLLEQRRLFCEKLAALQRRMLMAS
jgi:putative transposase